MTPAITSARLEGDSKKGKKAKRTCSSSVLYSRTLSGPNNFCLYTTGHYFIMASPSAGKTKDNSLWHTIISEERRRKRNEEERN